MSKRFLVIVLASLLVVILICFMILVPVSSNVAEITVTEMSQSAELDFINDVISFHISDQTDCPAYYETVYAVENRYLLRAAETIYIIPYVTANIEDVGTAGTSHWTFNLNAFSVSKTDSTAIKAWNPARIKDFTFTVQAGTNTLMTSEFSCSFYDELSLTQEELEPISPNNYTVILDVATELSAGMANAERQASFQWDGNITPGAFMRSIPFKVNAAIKYIGNLKF